MVNLALYGLGMDVSEVFQVFKDLSSRVFRGRIRLGFGPVDTIHTLLAAYWNGRFPDEDIDGPLYELFGTATMLEHPYMTAIGARTGFPVVNVDTLDTCLVTSYNGAGKSRPGSNAKHRATYHLLRSGGHNDKILVKDGVRSASAAPGYFTPYTIPRHGTFMDGGLSSNNPSLLALQEAHRLAPELKRPDQFVSVGTGVSKAGDAYVANTRSSRYGNNSLFQAAQHYWRENFDGDKQFASMRHVMDTSAPGDAGEIDGWFRRFNLPLDGQLPDLADADAIDNLAEAAWSYFESHEPIRELALSSIASLFYFELRCMPAYGNGRYTCYGRILGS
ncbi:hypothetical protein HBI08_239800 [Parastagonospora nodorum]|nr:hypothetical protein HBI08_239800 [Parastagonospora nodorum]